MTRFYNSIVKNQLISARLKTENIQKNLLGSICILLIGFLTGNLFGTVLAFIRKFMVWDGLIILSLIVISEIISYISYKPKGYKVFRKPILAVKPLQAEGLLRTTQSWSPLNRPRRKKNEAKSRTNRSFARQSVVRRGFVKANERIGFAKAKLRKPIKKYQYKVLITSGVNAFFNFFKIGVLIGFFVDAFKVGS